MSIRELLTQKVEKALQALYSEGYLTGDCPKVFLVPPKMPEHGDFACTVALSLAKVARKKPQEIGQKLQEKLGLAEGLLSKTDVAGPGYVNMFLAPATLYKELGEVFSRGEDYLSSNAGQGEKVLIEYVSANPTGPLHIAHGRGAVTGDVIARLLKAAGYAIEREYYVNDLGNQTDVMARSVYLRYAELHGQSFVAPEDFYPGEYIIDIAQSVKQQFGDKFLNQTEEVWLETFKAIGIEQMLERIKTDLQDFGITFDTFVSERALMAQFNMPELLEKLKPHLFVEEGKTWFRSTTFGDDKDRVMIREDGRPTYFASDIAYHADKLQRGYKHLINIWGADHGGYVTRVKAGIAALGYDPNLLDVILVQMVSLSRDGEAVRMGKRLGTAVWLSEVLKEAGKDATRYFFSMRKTDAQMDFDVTLATKKSLDNPVYYAQMGHARLCSIKRKATFLPTYSLESMQALTLPEELWLLKLLSRAPDVIADAARLCEPHQVVQYLQELIAAFHSYYTQYKQTDRVISEDVAKTTARLLMCEGLQKVMAALLHILGVEAPESMYLTE